MKPVKKSEVLAFDNATEWKSWLAEHHRQPGGVWLRIAKKGGGKKSITISDALDVALCYGWIDSQRKGLDSNYYLQRYSPRQRRSPWSKLNVTRAERLIDAGKMRAAGLAEICAAKADGRWAGAYRSQLNIQPPRDFTAALKSERHARAAFQQLNKTARYGILLPILKATNPKIREARVQQAIAKLASHREPSQGAGTAKDQA
jgi:uncharacterized protein YdeI (YjbR/CyaY-like superfamily)